MPKKNGHKHVLAFALAALLVGTLFVITSSAQDSAYGEPWDTYADGIDGAAMGEKASKVYGDFLETNVENVCGTSTEESAQVGGLCVISHKDGFWTKLNPFKPNWQELTLECAQDVCTESIDRTVQEDLLHPGGKIATFQSQCQKNGCVFSMTIDDTQATCKGPGYCQSFGKCFDIGADGEVVLKTDSGSEECGEIIDQYHDWWSDFDRDYFRKSFMAGVRGGSICQINDGEVYVRADCKLPTVSTDGAKSTSSTRN